MPALKFFLRRFMSLLRPERTHNEIADELAFHIEQRTEENIRRGMSAEEAREDARRRFGHLTRIREEGYEVRGGGWPEIFLQDLTYGLRVLRRNPAFTLTAVITLALGIGANTALFAVLESVILRPLPYDHPERLFLVREKAGADNPSISRLSGPDFDDIHDQSRSFEKATMLIPYFTYTWTGDGEARNLKCTAITHEFFPMLGIQPILGRLYTPEEYHVDGGTVVISAHFWKQQLGGDPHVLGRNMKLGGGEATVIGVMPDLPDMFPDIDIWAKVIPELEFMHWRQNKFLSVMGRLKPGVTRQQAEQEITAILGRVPGQPPGLLAMLVPLKDELVGKVSSQLKIAMGAVLLVLLITCVNVMCLLLARACERGPEVALRLSLGARPARIVRQFVTENLVLVSMGSVLGVVLAAGILHLVRNSNFGNLPRTPHIGIDGYVLALAIAAAFIISLLLAWGPAAIFRRLNLNMVLKSGRTMAGRPRAFRWLVISEVGCSIVLVVGAGLLVRSFWLVQHVDPGFEPDHLLTAYLRTNNYSAEGGPYYDGLLARVAHAPGIQSVALADCMPARSAATARLEFNDRPNDPANPVLVDGCWISPEFFPTIGARLGQGRWFNAHDNATAPPVVIVNRTLADKYWPGENSIGKRIAIAYTGPGRRTTGTIRFREVVGVIADLKQRALDQPVSPALYMAFHQDETNHVYASMSLFVHSFGEPLWSAETVRKEIRAYNPDQTIDNLRTMDDVVLATLAPRRFSLVLLSSFAALALVLAAVGIYGMIAFSLSQRTREMGIRIALGATRPGLLGMIVREGVALAGIGVIAGVGLALLLTRTMAGMLFGVKAIDPVSFISAALLLIGVAAAASFVPARRASKCDPMEVLRAE